MALTNIPLGDKAPAEVNVIIENPIGDMTNGFGQGDAYPMLKTYTVGLNLSF